jgi:pimeloyl-ACP methyl ester carboxylesterase/enoyl-CoA hydratase/carnithine racemase
MSEELIVETRGRVLQITLATADGRNEISDAVLAELTALFCEPREDLAAIVLHARGSDFCQGRVASLPPASPAGANLRDELKTRVAAPILALYDAIDRANVPVACFVHGLASGMGCALVAACDHAVAATDSRFSAPELEKQFAPGLLMSALSRRLHPKAIARLVLTMQSIDAKTALAVGLIGEIVEPAELEAARERFVAAMNSRAPLALAGIKRYWRDTADLDRAGRAELAATVTAETVAARSLPFNDNGSIAATGRIRLGREEITYDDVGEGPPLVLLHSLGTSRRLWHSVIPTLALHHRVIALDARGHGGSSNHAGYLPEGVAEDVVGLVERLGLDRFSLLGISMGGLTAVRVAAALGPRVRALVLSSTYASVAGPAAEQRIGNVERMLERMPMAAFARAYAEQTLAPTTPYDAREALAEQIATVSKSDYLTTLRAIGRDDVSRLLDRIESRCLVLKAEFDLSVPRAVSQKLVDGIRGAASAEVPGARHLACIDAPDLYAAIVDTFLASTRENTWNS